jgi:hypothetical protein
MMKRTITTLVGIVLACLWQSPAVVQASTVQYQVAATADDTYCTSTNNSNYGATTMRFPYSSDTERGFLRWAINVPDGATIQSAYLKVKATGSAGDANPTTVRLQLLDYDNCPSFATPGNPYNWAVAAGSVDWQEPGTWTAGTWYTSPDIKTIVQTFIDRAGYSPGNYLGLRGQRMAGLYKYVYQWANGTHTDGAILEVTYSTNVAPTANAGSDQSVTDDDDSGSETVTLNGSASSDPDGTIVSYVWTEGGSQVATGAVATVSLAVGTHVVSLTVTDNFGATASDVVSLTVNSQPKTMEYSIAASGDDTYASTSGNYYNNTSLRIPYNNTTRAFLRWSVNIPCDSTIQSAGIRLCAYSTSAATASTVGLQLLDYDSCPVLSGSGTSNPYSFGVTTGSVNWTEPAVWTKDQWYTSPALTTLVQEFVDRPGYAQGNYFGLRAHYVSGVMKEIYQRGSTNQANLPVLSVVFIGNYPPTANAGPNQVLVDADYDGFAWVTLDGSGSADADDSIAGYVWAEGGTTIATGAAPVVSLAAGIHTITLTVTDRFGATAVDTVQITVHSVYYVDFDGGNDAYGGTTPATAWKHCPGDANATGVAAATTLIGGCKIVFKGGVVYRGMIDGSFSGSAGLPVTYDGNTAGTFGTGKAILDGSEPMSGWTQCTSAAEAGGNPNYANIWYAYAPAGTDANTSNLYQTRTSDGSDHLCWLAQNPNPSEPLFMDTVDDFFTIPTANVTRTSITDPTYLTQSDPNYWNGACVMIWVQPNMVDARNITSYDPTQNKITFATTSNDPYPQFPGRYAVYNHIRLIDQPGEYYFNDTAEANGTHKVWLWPKAGNPNDNSVSVSVPGVRHSAFRLTGNRSYLTFTGLVMRKYAGGGTYGGRYGGAGINANAFNPTHVVVTGCEFYYMRHDYRSGNGYGALTLSGSDHLVDGNVFVELPVTNAMQFAGSNSIFRSNYIERPGRMGLWSTFTNCQILDNFMTDVRGVHADGIAVFLWSSDVLVMGNTIINSGVPFCTERSSNVTVAYNLFHCPDFYAFADYGESTNLKIHNNTILRNTDMPSARLSPTLSTYEFKNNISYVSAGQGSLTPDGNHNLNLNHSMDATVFENAAGWNYHLRSGSPAIDAGEDLDYENDIEGTDVPQGDDPDIGAYERTSP